MSEITLNGKNSTNGDDMGMFARLMVDNDCREEIFIFQHGEDLPIGKLTRQDVLVLRQSLEAIEKQSVSMTVPAPADGLSVKRSVVLSKFK